ncbi:MAG: DNA primase [Victivallaceae bacterium]|nr:DNA primase [Victivallaceae bacterium]
MINRGIPDDVVEEIRGRSNIVDVVGRVVPLKKAGNGSWKACCPFHQEKTPSFVVSEQRQHYHCFGCGAGGDVFKFVMQTENVDFPNAVHLLAGRCGVVIPEAAPNATPAERQEAKARAGRRERLYAIMEAYTGFFERTLASNPDSPVARYLETRKLDRESIKKFRIGAAPDSWDAGMKFGRGLGYTDQELLDTGMILRNEESGRLYDRFRNRLVFPITNEQGRVVAFSARTIEKDFAGAKYVNSPETPLFRKSQIVYGLSHARPSIGTMKKVVLCEGQLDVIAMHRAGCTCAVAPQGTAFTEEQARILRRYTDCAVLSFDADGAGQKAVLRALEILFSLEFEVKILAMPGGKDPDGMFARNGAAALMQVVDNPIDVLDFLIRVLRTGYDMESPFGQSRFLGDVLGYVEKIPDPVVRENYVRRLAEQLQLKVELVYSELKKLRRKKAVQPRFRPSDVAPEDGAPAGDGGFAEDHELIHAEDTLFELALFSESLARRIGDEVGCDELSGSVTAKAVNMLAALALNGEFDLAVGRINELDRETGDSRLSRLIASPGVIAPERAEQALNECLAALARRRLEARKLELIGRLKSATTPEEKAELLKAFTALK